MNICPCLARLRSLGAGLGHTEYPINPRNRTQFPRLALAFFATAFLAGFLASSLVAEVYGSRGTIHFKYPGMIIAKLDTGTCASLFIRALITITGQSFRVAPSAC